MKTVMVGPELEENLSVRYLASAVRRAGHACTIIPFNARADLPRVTRAVLRARPDLVGLSLVAQRRYEDFRTLIANLRRSGYAGHITAGGQFASLRAPEVLRDTAGLDTVLHHDGEERLVRLLSILDAAATGPEAPGRDFDPAACDGITWREPDGGIRTNPPTRVADLDSLSFPVRGRPRRSLGLRLAPVVTGRGCSGSCSFCSIHAWHRQVPSGRLRLRSPANVVGEMIALHRERGVRVFIFHDDDFILPDSGAALRRCREILDAAEREIGPFAFVIKCRPDDVEESLFRYLKSRGLARAYVGIETHAASGLSALGRGVRPETNLRALQILRDLDVYACFNLLLFHPDTTVDELRQNLDFLRAHLRHPFDVARTELYAESTLERRMLRAGRALGDYRGYDYRISDPRAEAVFQRFASILWNRHFGSDSILHRIQDLGLRMSLLRRFHPEAVSPELVEKFGALVVAINADTVAYVERMLAASCSSPQPVHAPAGTIADPGGCADEDGRALMLEVTRRGRHHAARILALALEIELRARIARTGLSALPPAFTLPRAVGRLAALPSIALLLGPLACSLDHTQVCDPPPPPVRFSTDIEPLLDQSCAMEGCHAAENPAAWLDLRRGVSRENLVGVPSAQVPRLLRVRPQEPDSSYLVIKLEGTQAAVGGSGERMPKGRPLVPYLVNRIQVWISRGAPNN